MAQSLVKGMNELGYSPEVQPLAFFQDDYGLKSPDGVDDTDDMDDDEEDEEPEDGVDDEEDEESTASA